MMVVKTNDIDGTALEEVVVGVGLVTTSKNRTRRIVTFDDICQVTGQQGVGTHLLTMCQCRGIMSGIQDKVRLFQGQLIGICRRPLLQHLVTDRPHQYTGMITVAQYQIGEVTLMPLIKETGIVSCRLLPSPHVKRLIHHDNTHRIAHVQQLRRRRIM